MDKFIYQLRCVVKMPEIKGYAMIVLSVALLTSLGFNIMPEPTHYCDETQTKAYCFSVSSTMKTCYTLPNKGGGKICSNLWKEIPKVRSGCNPIILAYTDNGRYICDGVDENSNCIDRNLVQKSLSELG